MRRSYSLTPAQGAVLISDSVAGFPDGLTVVNTGQSNVYLGDDGGVTPDNGVPLPAGLSTIWSGSAALWAAVADGGTLLITDNMGMLSAAIPSPEPPPNEWDFAKNTVGIVPGFTEIATSAAAVLAGPALAQCLFTFPLYPTAGGTATIGAQLNIRSTINNIPSAIASFTHNGAQTWVGVVDDVQIPYGGYTIELANTGPNTMGILTGAVVTLVRNIT